MSETKDRPDADPAIEATAIDAAFIEEADGAASLEAEAFVVADTVAEPAEAEPEAAPEPAPEDVVATAVLVVEETIEVPAEVAEELAAAVALEIGAELAALPHIVDDLGDPDASEDLDPPLLDDEIEHGIAEVFAALQAAAERGEITGTDEDDESLDTVDGDQAIDGITFRLLGELDRLWHRAA